MTAFAWLDLLTADDLPDGAFDVKQLRDWLLNRIATNTDCLPETLAQTKIINNNLAEILVELKKQTEILNEGLT